jgi:GAF domain-containing protein
MIEAPIPPLTRSSGWRVSTGSPCWTRQPRNVSTASPGSRHSPWTCRCRRSVSSTATVSGSSRASASKKLQTPRSVAFCAHTILQKEHLIVQDARQDPRFADNPLVLRDPAIQFYAGYPLEDEDGHRLAVLCVMDHQPRSISVSQMDALKEMASWAEQELRSIGLERALRL